MAAPRLSGQNAAPSISLPNTDTSCPSPTTLGVSTVRASCLAFLFKLRTPLIFNFCPQHCPTTPFAIHQLPRQRLRHQEAHQERQRQQQQQHLLPLLLVDRLLRNTIVSKLGLPTIGVMMRYVQTNKKECFFC